MALANYIKQIPLVRATVSPYLSRTDLTRRTAYGSPLLICSEIKDPATKIFLEKHTLSIDKIKKI